MDRCCKTCQQERPLSAFPNYKGKTGSVLYRYKCKACTTKESIARIKADPAQRARKQVYDKEWRQSQPERVAGYRQKQKQNMKRFTNHQRDELTEAYVRNRLGLKMSDPVSPELIEAKRLQIKVQRLLKEKNHDHEVRLRAAGRFA